MSAPLATVLAIISGLVILAGYFYSVPVLQSIRSTMLEWSVILFGVVTLIGVINLLSVHWRKIVRGQRRDIYSTFLVLAFLITFTAGMWFGPADPIFQQFVFSIQVPVETSLLAVMSITLLLACMRILSQRMDAMSIIFILSTIIFLLAASNLTTLVISGPILNVIISVLNRLPMSGARGLLIGVALGTITTGLRIILGSDRPYAG
jgi:hypothetical protein